MRSAVAEMTLTVLVMPDATVMVTVMTTMVPAKAMGAMHQWFGQ